MQVEKIRPQVIDDILDMLSKDYKISMEREGIHTTDLLYCLRKAFWNKTAPLLPTPQETMYYLSGLGLQDALLRSIPSQPIMVDGIWMSPDYLDDNTLLELKTTMIGQKRLDAFDFPEGWVKQLMAYCYGYKRNSAILLVLTLLKREMFSYVLTFTDEELEENWSWIRMRTASLMMALNSGVVPRERGFDFECNNCRYRLRCSLLDIPEQGISQLSEQLSK